MIAYNSLISTWHPRSIYAHELYAGFAKKPWKWAWLSCCNNNRVEKCVMRDMIDTGTYECLAIDACHDQLICHPDAEILTPSGWQYARELRVHGEILNAYGEAKVIVDNSKARHQTYSIFGVPNFLCGDFVVKGIT